MITKKQSAFSLMEIIIVVTIIGVLAGMVGPRIVKAWKKVKETTTKNTLRSVQSAINEYYGDVRKYPTKLDDLTERPSGVPGTKWRGPYLKEEELDDGWGTPIEYSRPPVRFKKEAGYMSYELISYGQDQEESDDDLHVGL